MHFLILFYSILLGSINTSASLKVQRPLNQPWLKDVIPFVGVTRSDLSQVMEPRAAAAETLSQTQDACAVEDTCLKRDGGGVPAPETGQ